MKLTCGAGDCTTNGMSPSLQLSISSRSPPNVLCGYTLIFILPSLNFSTSFANCVAKICVIVSSVLQVARGHAYLCSPSTLDFAALPLALEYPKNTVPTVITTRTTARITLVNFPFILLLLSYPKADTD